MATIVGIILGLTFSINIEEIRQFLLLSFNIHIFPEDVYFLSEIRAKLI